MSCEAWHEMIIDRLVDELPEDEAIRLEQHLAECSTCAAEQRRLQELLQASTPREEWVSDPRVPERLANELRGLHRRPRLGERLRALISRPLPVYASLAFAALAIAVGFWAGQTVRPTPPTFAPGNVPPGLSPQATSPSRQPVAGGGESPGSIEEHATLAAALVERPDSRIPGGIRFVAMPADAFPMERASAPDSL